MKLTIKTALILVSISIIQTAFANPIFNELGFDYLEPCTNSQQCSDSAGLICSNENICDCSDQFIYDNELDMCVLESSSTTLEPESPTPDPTPDPTPEPTPEPPSEPTAPPTAPTSPPTPPPNTEPTSEPTTPPTAPTSPPTPPPNTEPTSEPTTDEPSTTPGDGGGGTTIAVSLGLILLLQFLCGLNYENFTS